MTADENFGTGAVLAAARNHDREQVIITRPRRGLWRDGWAAERILSTGLLAGACVLLAGLAVTMGVVSWHAQYVFVLAAKHQRLAAALEALGLDTGAVIFAVLGIALARLGRRAVIERALVCACAAGSGGMNLLGADLGSPRSVAVFVMPPLLFAAGSDRLIAVIRRAALGPAEDGQAQRSAWRLAGLALLYVLRLAAAPPSTMAGARRALLNATPLPALAPSDQQEAVPASATAAARQGSTAGGAQNASEADRRRGHDRSARRAAPGDAGRRKPLRERGEDTKTARFLRLVEQQYGPLADFDLAKVSRIAAELAPQVGLHPGSARSALRTAVLNAQAEAGPDIDDSSSPPSETATAVPDGPADPPASSGQPVVPPSERAAGASSDDTGAQP